MATRTGNEQTIWRVPIWDVTLPSFASGLSYVYGTESDLKSFMSARRQALDTHVHDQWLDAYEHWLVGEEATVSVAFSEHPFAEEVSSPIAIVRVSEARHEETYQNTYGFPYEVHSDRTVYDIMLVEEGNQCLRLIKVLVTGMTLATDDGPARPVSSCWGEPGIICLHDDGKLSTTMFLPEHAYDDADSALVSTMSRPSLSLSPVVDHIVADG